MRRAGVHAGQRVMVLTLLDHPSRLSGRQLSTLHFSLVGGRHPICAHSRIRGIGHAGERYRRVPVIKQQSNERQEEHERLRTSDSEGVMLFVYFLLLLAASDPLQAWAEIVASSGCLGA